MIRAHKSQVAQEKAIDAALGKGRRSSLVSLPDDSNDPVLDFMGAVSPHLKRPEWARPYTQLLKTAIDGGHRAVFSAPPQHGKTQATLHALAYLIIKYPDRRHAYITFSQKRANSVSIELQGILRAAGVEVSGTLDMVRWAHGKGRILMVGIDGGITGEPIDGICVCDDLIKNIQEAQSAATRHMIEATMRSSVFVRVHEGSSIVVMATRWDTRDISGTLVDEGWQQINIQAIAEEGDILGRAVGEPLFPELWSLDALERVRRESHEEVFEAMYQGRPRLRGGNVFHEPSYYTELPRNRRGALGVDLAYSDSGSSDWTVIVNLLREETATGPRYYVQWVDRVRIEATECTLLLRSRHAESPMHPMLWRGAFAEKAVAKFMRKAGVPLKFTPPPGNKYVSSLEVAALWNQGRVLLPDLEAFPECEIWLHDFVAVVMGFTGNNREVDDDVDALANAHHALRGGAMSAEDERLPAARI